MYRDNEKCHVPWCIRPVSDHGDEHQGETVPTGRFTQTRVRPVGPRDHEPDCIEAHVIHLTSEMRAALSIGNARLPSPRLTLWQRITRFVRR